MLDFYVDLGAIDETSSYQDIYDGYQLSFFNMYMEQALEEEYDMSLICLNAKDACNCTICAGLVYNDSDEIVVEARYYANADDFEDFVDGNIDEPDYTDISDQWFAVQLDGDYVDSSGDSVDLTAALGDGYQVWRWQPKFEPSSVLYGSDYRFQAGDIVKPYVWLQDYYTETA